MADETDTTGEAARVLGEHQYYVPQGDHPDGVLPDDVEWECAGCAHGLGADDVMEERHVAHMAQVLAEAGLLRDQATIDALNERCRILVDEGDRLRAQIAAQDPAGATQGGSGDSRASGGLDGAAASPLDEVHEMFFGKDAP